MKDRQPIVNLGMRSRNNMSGHDFTNPARRCGARIDGGAHSPNFAPLGIASRRYSVVMTKEFVRPIHQINFQMKLQSRRFQIAIR